MHLYPFLKIQPSYRDHSQKLLRYFIILFVSIFILAGCVTPPKLAETEFHLTQYDTALLPDPAAHKNIEHQQLLTTAVRGHEISFYGIVTIEKGSLELMALTPLGIRIFNTIYDGSSVTTTQYIPDIPLPNMTEVIANIMLAYYSIESWELKLPEGFVIEESLFERKIYNSQHEAIFIIQYQWIDGEKRPTQIHNSALNYTIKLNNLES